MNERQITARLVAAHAAYVEKTGKQPKSSPSAMMGTSGIVDAWFYTTDYDHQIQGHGKTFAAAIDILDAAIAAIPPADEQARNEAAKAVANAIEKCRAAGYDGEVLDPLADLAKRISENALTHEVTG